MDRKEAILHVAIWVATFIAFSLLWELAVVKFALWSWKQLLLERHLFSVKEAFITFLGVAFMSLIVIPHAAWVPVIALKEFLDYLRRKRELQLQRYYAGWYTARPRH